MPSFCLQLTTPETGSLPVYISGNFNDWLPDEKHYQMQSLAEGQYSFCFPETTDLPDPLEYKYTRGGWDQMETDENGNDAPNRIVELKQEQSVDFVPRWQENIATDPALLPETHVISETFEIPQLGRHRRVTALLPHDYHQTDRRYPVIYMQDAQNLFDDQSPYGNWAIDRSLAKLAARQRGDVVVIAIDHGDEERVREFLPYETDKWGRGQGRKYIRFLAQTLKPYVDSHFRTLPDRQHTGVGGSSMGGLVSIYAGLMFPQVFGRLMVFSPSLWVSPKIYFDAIGFFNPSDTKIYLYAGGRESFNMVPSVERFKETLERRGMDHGQIRFKLSINPGGRHHEAVWAAEFPKALEWLFFLSGLSQAR